jgi:tRNA(adenine34) deaminase
LEFNSEQEALIQTEIDRLRGADDAVLAAFNADSIIRRTAWFVLNRETFAFLADDPLDSAYRLLLARFGIPPEEAPVVARSERSITFHSQNFCPTLEACRRLGLDTRHVCRLYNEDATNRLIRQIDPRLRFSRNYEKLRPYAPYCEETITLDLD